MYTKLLTLILTEIICINVSLFAQTKTITISPSHDNTLYEDDNGMLSNGAGPFIYAGTSTSSLVKRALIKFKIDSNIPASVTITKVVLKLNMVHTPVSTRNVALYAVSANWGEGTSVAAGSGGGGIAATQGDATWLYSNYLLTKWNNPGGDFNSAKSTLTPVNEVGVYTWSSSEMAKDVQNWLNDPASNFGWILIGEETTTPPTNKRFCSKDNPDPEKRPVLEVSYTPVKNK